MGVVLYTSADDVASDPEDPTNDAGGSTTWCTAPSGGTVVSGTGICPTSKASVTAIRITAPGTFPAEETLTATIRMDVKGNTDLASGHPSQYINAAVARLGGLSAPLGPNSAGVTVTSASLGDLVWSDLDGDGTQDNNEPGLANVPISLSGTDDLGNTVTADTVTDASGHYQFTGLPGGHYIMMVEGHGARFTTTKAGSDPHIYSVATSDGQAAIAVAAGGVDTDADIGLVPVSISGTVWDDIDGDGIWSGSGGPDCRGEAPLTDIPVTLTGTNVFGADVAMETATAAGYEFAALFPGTYDLVFGGPTGYETSPLDQGSDDSIDSDGSRTLTVGPDPITHFDAGYHLTPGSIVLSSLFNGDATLVPVGATAPVTWTTCGATGTIDLPLNGSSVTLPFPAGTSVTIDAAEPDAIPNTSWGPPQIDHGSITVETDAESQVTVEQTLRRDGGFSVTAVLTGSGVTRATDSDLGLTWTATVDGRIYSDVVELTPGEPVRGPTLPEGTVVAFGPVVHPANDDALYWESATIDPMTLQILPSGLSSVTVVQPTTRVTAATSVAVRTTGSAAADFPASSIPVKWTYVADDGTTMTGVFDAAPDGVPVEGPSVPTGTEMTFTLLVPEAIPGLSYSVPDPVRVVSGGTATLDLEVLPVLGTVTVHATVTGTGASDVTGTLTVPYTVSRSDETVATGSVTLAPGSEVIVDTDLRIGDRIDFGDVEVPATTHVVWGTVQVDPASLTIDEESQVELSAVATRATGSFSLHSVVDGSGLPALIDSDSTIPVIWSTVVDGSPRTGTLELPSDGTAVSGPTLPEGTVVELTLGTPTPRADGDWTGLGLNAPTVTVGSSTQMKVTGTYTARTLGLPVRLSVTSNGSGISTDVVTVAYHWTWAGTSGAGSIDIAADGSATVPDLPIGAVVSVDSVTLPQVPGATWGSAASTEVTVGADSDLRIIVPLTIDTGTFTVTSTLAGNGAALAPETATVTLYWSATVRGTITTGTLDVPVRGSATGPQLPEGSVVTFTASAPTPVSRAAWGPTQVPAPITIGRHTATSVRLTQTVTATTGSFTLRLVTGATLTKTVSVSYETSDGQTGVLALPTDGTPVAGPIFPVGTVVTISLPDHTGIEGTSWATDTNTQTTIEAATVVEVVLAAELTAESLAATGAKPSQAMMLALAMLTIGMVAVVYVNRRRQYLLLSSRSIKLREPSHGAPRRHADHPDDEI